MAYGLFSASYGSYNAYKQVCITDSVTGLPATILSSSSGGFLNDRGSATLDESGNLAVFVDLSKTWHVEVFEESFRPNNAVNVVQEITTSDLSNFKGSIGVTYILRETDKQYFWDGTQLVPFPDRFQLTTINSLSNQTFSSFTYNVSGKLQSYIRDGIPHTVTYPSADQIVIRHITGTSSIITLDSSGRLVAIL